jgi:hypothetical protein
MSKAILKRIEALESARAARKAEPTAVDMAPFFADLALLLVAKPRRRESLLTAYCRGARYRKGVTELFEVAFHNPDRFYSKHAAITTRPSPHRRADGKPLPPIVPSREHVEDIRHKIAQRFVVEELAHRIIDAAEAATGHRTTVHEPLSAVRPMRAAA